MRKSLATIIVALVLVSSSAIAQMNTVRIEQLQSQIDALKSDLAQLRARPHFDSEDVDAVVRAVMADARRQSDPIGPLLPNLAGADGDGFYLKSDDGNYLLRPVVQFQFRGVASHRSQTPERASDTQSGFEIRRMEFSVEGHAISPRLTYEFKWVTERDGGGFILEDAYLQYEFRKGWAVLFGQFRDPVFHEELVSSKYLLAADRTLVNTMLGAQTGFVQGVSLVYGDRDTPLHAALAFHDGAGSINTPFTDSVGEPGFVEHFGISSRIEYKLAGDWKNYKDFTALGTGRDLLVIGAAADWTQGAGIDAIFATVDAQWKTAGGLGTYGALLFNYLGQRDAGDDQFDFGALIQTSYLFTPNWEVFARYDFTSIDAHSSAAADFINEFTFGFNRYLGVNGRLGHRAKLTFDATYLPQGSPIDATGLGILAGDDAEFVLRGQFQLVL